MLQQHHPASSTHGTTRQVIFHYRVGVAWRGLQTWWVPLDARCTCCQKS